MPTSLQAEAQIIHQITPPSAAAAHRRGVIETAWPLTRHRRGRQGSGSSSTVQQQPAGIPPQQHPSGIPLPYTPSLAQPWTNWMPAACWRSCRTSSGPVTCYMQRRHPQHWRPSVVPSPCGSRCWRRSLTCWSQHPLGCHRYRYVLMLCMCLGLFGSGCMHFACHPTVWMEAVLCLPGRDHLRHAGLHEWGCMPLCAMHSPQSL